MTRSRTSPELKWLANELAVVMGEITRLDEHLAVLTARRQDLVKVRDSLDLVGRVLGTPALAQLVPEVRAHRGRRGRLLPFLRAAVEQAAPATLNTATLVRMAEEQLQFTFETAKARAAFRDNNVSRAMRKLVAHGLVERVNDDREARATGGEWRWKAPAGGRELLVTKECT